MCSHECNTLLALTTKCFHSCYVIDYSKIYAILTIIWIVYVKAIRYNRFEKELCWNIGYFSWKTPMKYIDWNIGMECFSENKWRIQCNGPRKGHAFVYYYYYCYTHTTHADSCIKLKNNTYYNSCITYTYGQILYAVQTFSLPISHVFKFIYVHTVRTSNTLAIERKGANVACVLCVYMEIVLNGNSLETNTCIQTSISTFCAIADVSLFFYRAHYTIPI